MPGKRSRTTDAVDIIHRRYFDGRPEHLLVLEEERANAEIARIVREMRVQAGLTQAQLAELVGTSQPNIARPEDADYEGHSLGMLRRIAAAMKMRVQLRFVPLDAA